MHPFLRKILDATRLTRSGQLAEATVAIQRALAEATQAGTHTERQGDVIDVEVVERPSAATRATDEHAASVAEPVHTVTGVFEADDERVVANAITARDAPTEADPDLVVDAPPVARPPSGRGRFLASSFTGAAGTRPFKLFVPEGFDGEALPLVVMLHGCTQNPDDFAAGTRMNAIAQEQGFFVLYPAQAPRSNSQKCWNWFSPQHQQRGSGEPALLAGMTRHILQTHGVDRDRVYVAGLSAGGAMAAILGRESPDVFAAAGVHSGVVPGAAYDVASAFAVMRAGPASANPASPFVLWTPPTAPVATSGSLPLIVFHGDADQTVVIANADAVIAAALGGATVVASTSQGMGATGERAFKRTVWRRDDAAPDAAALAEHWVVHGSPHAWSGGDPSGSFTDPSGPDASREMLRFFAEHPRAGTANESSARQEKATGTTP